MIQEMLDITTNLTLKQHERKESPPMEVETYVETMALDLCIAELPSKSHCQGTETPKQPTDRGGHKCSKCTPVIA
jgi:hypothetical protein